MTDADWARIVAHRDRLTALARRRCPSRSDAEDVVQEAMIRCATFRDLDEERLGQFLTSVTLRLCADLHRVAERRDRMAYKLAPESDEVPGPEEEVCRAAEAEQVAGVLATLPERQRAVLVDRAYGLSVTQISDRHALTYKAAESALSRARAAMRAGLAAATGAVAAFLSAGRRSSRKVAVAMLPVAAVMTVGAVLRAPATVSPADPVPAKEHATTIAAYVTRSTTTAPRAVPHARARTGRQPAAETPYLELPPGPGKRTPHEIVKECVGEDGPEADLEIAAGIYHCGKPRGTVPTVVHVGDAPDWTRLT